MSRNFSTSAKATISSNLLFDFRAAHAEDGAVEKDVFAPGQFRMKAGADFEQAGHAPVDAHPACGRFGDAAEDFEQRALAGAVAADDADDFAAFDFEGNILERPELLASADVRSCPADRRSEPLERSLALFRAMTSRKVI